MLGHLAELPPATAVEAISRFEQGLGRSEVRNISAYFSSVIRRLAGGGAQQGGAAGGQGGGQGSGQAVPGLHELCPQAQQVMGELWSTGRLRPSDLDGKCLHILAGHPPAFQVLALDTFGERNLSGVRNMAGPWPPCTPGPPASAFVSPS